MLGIVLSVLKVLGILILIILGILIVAILCVLFVPFRYKITLKAHPVSMSGFYDNYLDAIISNDVSLKGSVSWLLHFFHLSIGYHKPEKIKKLSKTDAKMKLYVFGIPIINFLKEKKNPKTKQKKQSKEKNKKNKVKTSGFVDEEEQLEGNNSEDHTFKENKADENKSSYESEMKENIEEESPKQGFVEKLGIFIQKLKKLFEKAIHIKYTISEKYSEFQSKKEKAVLMLDYFRSKEARPAIDKIKKEIGHLLKKICPKRFYLFLVVGSEKADLIGELLAIFGLLIPITKDHIMIQPDFMHIRLEGDMEIKGSITVFMFLKVAWKYFFDKDIKALKERLKGLK